MVRLTQLAVAKRSVTLLLAIGLFASGIFSWSQLNQELLPDIQLPIIVVATPMPGAGATDVTEQVTKPIERAMANVPRLEHLNSTSVNSYSLAVAQFAYGTDVKATKDAIDTALKGITLPTGATPNVMTFDINALPTVVVAIQGNGSAGTPDALVRLSRSVLIPELQGLDGVSKVDLTGGSEQRVVIALDPAKLAAAKISTTTIQGVLTANNITIPAGQLTTNSASIPVSALHQITSVDEIKGLVVGVQQSDAAGAAGSAAAAGSNAAGGASASASPAAKPAAPVAPKTITIGDLGTVTPDAVQSTGFARLDQQSAVLLTVSKSTGANTVNVADAVREKLDALKGSNQFGYTVVEDLSSYIKESRDGLVREGGLGALFAVVVIFLFLLSLRSTLVAAVSIPLSIMAALTLMLVGGITINIMTLGGLAVAVGRVVDDAIVVLENIYRHRGRGDPMAEAVISGTREVASAITSSTLTTVAVFLPLGFIGGLVSQFFLPFALTVTFALLSSLVCALTVVPVLATLFIDRIKLNPDEGPKHHETIWQRIYTPLLRLALTNRISRWAVIAVALLMFMGTGLLIPHIPTAFINAGSEKFLQITVAPPAGTPSATVLARAQQAESILHTDGDINLIETTVPEEGGSGMAGLSAAFTGKASNTATIQARFDNSTDLTAAQTRVAAQLKPLETEGWRVEVAQQNFAGGGSLSIVVSGKSADDVRAATGLVLERLQARSDLINVRSDLGTAAQEIQVQVDPNKAILAGTTTAQVGQEIRTILSGQTVGVVGIGGVPVEVDMRVAAPGLTTADALKLLTVGPMRLPLASVATVTQGPAQARVSRVDQAPAATISLDTTSRDTGSVSRAVQKELDDLKASGRLGAVDVTMGGVTEQMNTAFGGMFMAMAVAVLLVYVVMVLVFNSLIDPFVIMFSLPLATIGAFPALFLTGRPIGVSALIGFLMLIGIVVTNAIVLLDLVEQLRHRGLSTYDALVQGGRTRVRPILMTAVATILALGPLGLGLNSGSIIASELATVVIGGLFTSTLLTLIVVPVVYSLVEGGKDGVRGWRTRRAAAKAAGETAEAKPTPAAS